MRLKRSGGAGKQMKKKDIEGNYLVGKAVHLYLHPLSEKRGKVLRDTVKRNDHLEAKSG